MERVSSLRQNAGAKLGRANDPEAMAPQLYLITPPDADPASFPARLMAVLSAAEFSALLIARGALDDATYGQLATAVINVAQGAGCAVLLEDDVRLARRLGADGVHVTGDAADLEAAVAALKPTLIVGAGNLHTRHDAMTAGEMDIDYVFFGPMDGAADAEAAELAQWWAETFEVPAVFSQPEATAESVDPRGAEFLALSASVWAANSPAEVVKAIAAAFEASA